MILNASDFAKSFGINESELDAGTIQLIRDEKLDIAPLEPNDRDALVLEIIQRIRNDRQVIASKDRTEVWERGWAENLALFRKDPQSDEALVPKFVRPGKPVRWFKNYYHSKNDNFELSYIKVLRHFIVSKYFADVQNIYEFGAGTGFNLIHANKIFPDKNLIGTDFVQPAVDLMNEIGATRGIPLQSSLFNMLTPTSETLRIQNGSGVWTFGSLEQLGGKLDEMIDYLIENRPDICVHVEPVVEFYEENNLVDYLAKWFQSQRGYSAGLVGLLENRQQKGEIEILKMQRLNFGSLMMEGYNLMVWKPVR